MCNHRLEKFIDNYVISYKTEGIYPLCDDIKVSIGDKMLLMNVD